MQPSHTRALRVFFKTGNKCIDLRDNKNNVAKTFLPMGAKARVSTAVSAARHVGSKGEPGSTRHHAL